MPGDYRLLYGDALLGSLVGEAPLLSLSFNETLNDNGTISGTVPIEADPAGIANLDPSTFAVARTALYIERDGVILGGGMLWTARADVEAGTLDFGGSGFGSYYQRRTIRTDVSWVNIDQLTIVQNLITLANARTSGNIGLVVVAPANSGGLRTVEYKGFERKVIADVINDLAGTDDGFDWRYTVVRQAETLVKQLVLTYPSFGRITNFVFEAGVNCVLLTYSEDGASFADTVDAFGAGEGDIVLISTIDTGSLDGRYPTMDWVVSYSTIRDQLTLDAKARFLSLRSSMPARRVEIVVPPDVEPAIGQYNVGDRVTVRAHRGWVNVDSYFRIVSMTLTLDASGEETMKVELVGFELFDF